MKNRALVVVAALALLLVVAQVSASQAAGDRGRTRTAQVVSGKAAGRYPPVGPSCGKKVSSSTIRCLNEHLLRVERNFKDFWNCSPTRGVSEYGDDPYGGTWGYVYADYPGQTPYFSTALDLDPGNNPTMWVVTWKC
jgi:hypothetical protein